MPQTPNLDQSILEAALAGLQVQRDRLDEQIAQVKQMLGGKAPATPAAAAEPAPRKGKRTMSAAARKRIAEAQRKRWEAFRGQQGGEAPAPKKRRGRPRKG